MNIGQYLKAKRGQCDVTIEFVAARTKINLNVLKRLEESDIENLPNKTYVRGFVQSYCKVLDLDFNEALVALSDTYNTNNETEKVQTPNPMPNIGSIIEQPKSNLPMEENKIVNNSIDFFSSLLHNKKFLFNTAIVIVTCIISVSIYKVLKKNIINTVQQASIEKTPEEEVDVTVKSPILAETVLPVKVEAVKEIKEDAAVQTSDASEPKKVIYVKNKDEDLFKSKKLKEIRSKKLAEKQKEIELKAIKAKKEILAAKETKEEKKENKQIEENKEDLRKFPERKFYKVKKEALFVINESAEENTDEDIFPADVKKQFITGKQNVYIKAIDGDTWITYKKNDKRILSWLIKKGNSTLIQADLIRLFIGNINVTKIFYNNKLITVSSKTGVKSLIFPEDRKFEFELPLFVPNKDRRLFTSEQYKVKMEEESIKFSKEKKI